MMYESEHIEDVEHDIVLEILADGTVINRTEGAYDIEVSEQ